MTGRKLPAGYTLVRERVMWTRWDPAAMRNRISHPVVATLTDPDGYARTFDTVGDAHAWLDEPGNVMAPEYDETGNVPSDQCETPASDYYAGLPAV